jgi:sugar transferase (PEP-CTERM/EpsH1 system associated)
MGEHRFGSQYRPGARVMTRKILFLCHRLPYPPNKGDKIRSHALLQHLASRGEVSLACFIDEEEDFKYLDTVRDLAHGDCYFERLSPLVKKWRSLRALVTGQAITAACFGSVRLQNWVDGMIRDNTFDDVVVFGSAMAPYLLKSCFPKHRVMFDMVDVDSDKWSQYAASSHGLIGWVYRREARILQRLECDAAAAFGMTLLVSPFEVETFRQIAPVSAAKIASLTNGVDLTAHATAGINPFSAGQHAIVMTGRMDYRPNYEGAQWFANQIMPLILKTLPDAKVYFVGACPPRSLQKMANAHVVVTGSVPDIKPYIRFADAVIAPLQIARGVQNKVLEALAMTKPVIATRESTRSLAVENGKQLWIANHPAHFAEAVISTLKTSGQSSVAATGRRYVEQHHDWRQILADFDLRLSALHGSEAMDEARPAAAVSLRCAAVGSAQ